MVATTTQANAGLVPFRYIGDHHAKPLWSKIPLKKFSAFEKFASNS